MVAVEASGIVDVEASVSPALLAVVVAVVLVWITLLTVFVLRRCREPWRDDGRPVFRRLPDGRLRFSWHVATELAATQRRVEAELATADTGPVVRQVAISDAKPLRYHNDSRRTS